MKEKIRKEFLLKRKQMRSEDVMRKSEDILSQLLEDGDYNSAQKVLYYVSNDNEVFTHELIKESKKEVFVPKMKDNKIVCCKITSFSELSKGAYGILEPTKENIVDVSEMDIVIVPGIAFDSSGNRIGYGNGFYDEFLKEFTGKKIGLCYDWQIVSHISSDEWDVKMNKIIKG